MEYDAEGRILKLSNMKENGNIISDFNYTYDKSGYIIEETARQDGKVVTTSYTYDSRGQLTGAAEVNEEYTQKVEYTYDNGGNRLTEKVSRTQWGSTHVVTDLVNTYDKNDRLIKQTNKADSWTRSISYTYDENGNMVRKDTPDNSFTTYQYDSENRLTAVQDGGALLFAALYDGNGDRVFTVAPRQNTGNWHDDWNDGRWAVAEPQNGYNDSKWVYGEDETEATEATEVTQPTEATEPTQPETKPTEPTEPVTEPTKPAETKPSGEDDGSWWEGKYEGGNTGVDDGQWHPDGTTKPTEPTQPTEATEATEPTNPDTTGIPAWDRDTVYLGGDKVIYNGNVYKAQWWTLGDVPGHVNEGPWKLVGEATQPTEPEETDPTEPTETDPVETEPIEPTETQPEETKPEETFPVNGSANYDLGMIRDVLFVPNGIDTAYEEENYVLTGYINNINTQYTQVLVEYGTSGAYESVYEYGKQRTSMYQNGQVYSYEYDGRGSVSELVNAIGDTQIKYSYGAYGETVSTAIGWNNPVTNPYRYNAERIDDVAGVPAFQYLRARYLNPYTASFLTQDSYLGDPLAPLSQNRYTYAQNNPVNYTDPSGHIARQSATSMLMESDGAAGYVSNSQLTVSNVKTGDSKNDTFINQATIESIANRLAAKCIAEGPTFTFSIRGVRPDKILLTFPDNRGVIEKKPWYESAIEDVWQFGADIYEDVQQFGADIYHDLELINFNPWNEDEIPVLDSKYISFYKGQFVIREDWGFTNGRSGSFGIIFLNKKEGSDPRKLEDDIETVRHEHGHYIQLTELGLPTFVMYYAIPSIFSGDIETSQEYYSLPWEYIADKFGGVDRGDYIDGSDTEAENYWVMTKLESMYNKFLLEVIWKNVTNTPWWQ